jgi:hypothetical protein
MNTRIGLPFGKKNRIRKFSFQTSVPDFPAAVDHEHLRRQTVSFLRLRPSSCMCTLSPRLHGRLETHKASRLLANTLPRRCFPAGRRQLQRPPPSQIRPYPPRSHRTHQIDVLSVDMRVCEGHQASKRNIRLAEREILAMVYKYYP